MPPAGPRRSTAHLMALALGLAAAGAEATLDHDYLAAFLAGVDEFRGRVSSIINKIEAILGSDSPPPSDPAAPTLFE